MLKPCVYFHELLCEAYSWNWYNQLQLSLTDLRERDFLAELTQLRDKHLRAIKVWSNYLRDYENVPTDLIKLLRVFTLTDSQREWLNDPLWQ